MGLDRGTVLCDEGPDILYEFEKPRTLVFSLVPEALKLRLAPLTPILVEMPLLLKFKCTPGMILILFLYDQAMI